MALGRYGGLLTSRSAHPRPSGSERSPTTTVTCSARPSCRAFSRATAAAARDMSIATTSTSRRSAASAHAITPEPVPRSRASSRTPGRGGGKSSRAHSTSVSVSGRGTRTSAVKRTRSPRNASQPTICCRGSRRARRPPALQDGGKAVERQADPVVGDARLGEVVGADPFAPLAGPHLTPPVGGNRRLLLLLRALEEPGLEHAHRLRPVLQLRAFVLTRDDE